MRCRLTRRDSDTKRELLTLREHLGSPSVFRGAHHYVFVLCVDFLLLFLFVFDLCTCRVMPMSLQLISTILSSNVHVVHFVLFNVLSSVLWYPLRFPHKNDVLFVLPPLFVRGNMSCLFLYLSTYGSVQHYLPMCVTWRLSDKTQEPLTLREHLGYTEVFWWVLCCSSFGFLCCGFSSFCVLCILLPISLDCFSSSCVLCVQCCLCLWIVRYRPVSHNMPNIVCVSGFFCLVVLCLVCLMLPVSLDCPFGVSKIYLSYTVYMLLEQVYLTLLIS